MNKKNIYFIILILLCIPFSFGIFEILTRTKIAPITFYMGGYTYMFDETIIYRLKPNSRWDIDERGFRLNRAEKTKDAQHSILIAGDSFAFGSNVEPQETIAAQLEKKLGSKYNVINMGVTGYGPDQSLIQLIKVAEDFNPEAVILTLFPANDLQDIDRNKLFMVGINRTVTPSSENILTLAMPRFNSLLKFDIMTTTLFNWKSRYFDLFSDIYHDEYDFDLMIDLNSVKSIKKKILLRGVIREYKKTVKSMGAKLIIIIIPAYSQIIDPEYFSKLKFSAYASRTNDRETYKISMGEEVTTIDLHPLFIDSTQREKLYDHKDGHLSTFGYKVVADIIYKTLGK